MNGEAIYGSRPWTQAAEGSLRFTVRGDAFYVTALEWPGDELRIEAAVPVRGGSRVVLLGREGENLPCPFEDGALVVAMPPGGPEAEPRRLGASNRALRRFRLSSIPSACHLLDRCSAGFPAPGVRGLPGEGGAPKSCHDIDAL